MRKPSNGPPATTGPLELVEALVMVTDRDGSIEFVNRGFEEASGYAGPEIIGRKPSFLKSGEHSNATYRELWRTVLKGEVYRGELINRRKDGRLFRESKAIYPLTDERGTIQRFVAIGLDVTERAELKAESERPVEVTDRIQLQGDASIPAASTLSAELLSVVENERKRIATELHDDIGQILTGIKMRIESAITSISNGNLATGQKGLAEVVPIIREAMDEVRRISLDLRPPMIDDLGILATIGWFCREFPSRQRGLRVELDLRIDERDIPSSFKIVIYRILQEAMNNVVQHAGAQVARVRLLRSAGNIELIVEDDGCGFDLTQTRRGGPGGCGLGLTNMRERAEAVSGSLSLETIKGAGTIVRAVFPRPPQESPRLR
jgi:PAS domain S-box-containing protein